MDLGNTIKELRKKKKKSQMSLAESSGITQTYLSLIEANKRVPTFNILEKISNALGISAPILIFYSMGDNDVPEDKKELYKILGPFFRKMIEKII